MVNEHIIIMFILVLSIITQVVAAITAFRLIPITGRRSAWSLIALALTLMAMRRVLPLYRLIAGDTTIPPDLLNEIIGLVLSMVMAAGIARIAPLFVARKQIEETLQVQYSTLQCILESVNALFFSVNREYQYTSFNREHASVMQAIYGANIQVGHSLLGYMTVPEDREKARQNLDRALAGEEHVESAYSGEEIRSRLYFEVSHSPIRAEDGTVIGVAVFSKDITERKRAEESLQHLNRELRAISNCNQILMRAVNERALLQDICHIICHEAGYRMAWVGYGENDDAKTVRPVAWAGCEDGYLAVANITWSDSERGHGPSGVAIRSGENAAIQDFATEPEAVPWRDEALRRGYRSSIALPLKGENASVFGALNIYSTEVNAFTPDEIRLLGKLAGDLAFGINVLRTRAERERAEEALHKSAQEIQDLYDHAPCGYHSLNSQGLFMRMNETELQWLGYTREEIIGKMKFSDIISGPSLQLFKDTFPVFKERGWVKDLEFELIRKDGTLLPVLLSSTALYDEIGNYAMSRSTLYDITERKRAEEALRESEWRYREIFDNVLDGLYLLEVTEEGRFRTIEVNPALERITGIPRSFSVGKTQEETVPADVAAVVNAKYQHCMEAGHTIEEEAELELPSGRHIFHSSLIPVRDRTGKVHRIIGISRDITEQKLAEEKIHRLNQELEQRVFDRTAELENANKELEAFAYSVSHDLRAPLRHIDGFLELLQKRTATMLDEKSQHYMATISDSARRMGILIDDLLSFSRMGRNEMSQTQVDLGELVWDVIREFNPETEGRNIEWQIAALPPVTGDPAMLRMVLTNLISNALKFTRPRQVTEVEIGCKRENETEITIFVRDNGVGFDMNYNEKLFGVFQRLHAPEDFEGTGIGLANVRRIIKRHGGRTWAEGQVDSGATFYFSLPTSGKDLT